MLYGFIHEKKKILCENVVRMYPVFAQRQLGQASTPPQPHSEKRSNHRN